MSYRVKSVTQLTGIPRNTLVAWERRYDLLKPRRSDGGYRVYEERDVTYLRELKRLVNEGVAISEAITRVTKPNSHPVESSQTSIVDRLVAVLLTYDREAAAPLLRRVEQLPFADAIRDVWSPLLLEVGRRWEIGEISVAHGHFVSGVAREALTAMLRNIGHGGTGPDAVFACLPEERHDLPMLCVAVRVALAGWRVVWLGAELPVADLCAFVATRAPDIVCLSAITPTAPELVLNVGRTVLSAAPRSTTLVLGGPSAMPLRDRQNARLWVCAGADELLERWSERGAGVVVLGG